MTKTSQGTRRLAAALLATCAVIPTAALAQQSPPKSSPTAVGEVVVTALKRTESVQDAPVTIAVVGADKLQAVAVTNPNDLNGVVPGLTIMTGVGGGPGVTFRGLGSNSALFSVETSVALFIDGVYAAHTRDYVTPMYDLDRIEMVKGTQGTLLGKNTSLGAISLVTRRAAPTFGYGLQTSYDFNTKTPRVEGYVNVPVSDKLQVRLAGLYVDDGGYYKNAGSGNVPKTRDISGRLSVRWLPIDNVDVVFIYQHDDHDQTGQNLEVIRDATAGATVAARALATGQTDFEANPDRRSEIGSAAFGSAPAGPTPFDMQLSDHVNLIANWNLGDFTLTSQSAYVNWHGNRLSDLDFVRANLFNLYDIERNRQFSQEFRIASPTDRKFSYLAGVYYYKNTWILNRTTYGYAPSPVSGSGTTFYTQPTESWSVFGDGTYKFTDQLSGTLGLRYTSEHKDGILFRPQGTGVLGAAFPAFPRTTLTNKEDDVDGDVGLQYKLEPGRMLYVSASKGSKGGGFQNSPTTVAGAAYKGEKAYTVEAGAKIGFDRGTFDIAVFQTTVKGFQFSHAAIVGIPPISQTVVDNSDVRSQGVEVNSAWRVLDDLTLSGGVVYAEAIATATSPAPPLAPVQVPGLVQPRAPKWSGTLDAKYYRPVNQDLALNVLGSLEFASKTFLQPNIGTTLNAPVRGAYAKFNLRVGIANEADGWEVALLGKNLTDVREPLFATTVTATGGGGNTVAYYGTMMPGREIVLQLSLKH
jgi:outer membrane receptor protein involved in Fe transport